MDLEFNDLEVKVKLKHMDYSQISGLGRSVAPQTLLRWFEMMRFLINTVALRKVDETYMRDEVMYMRWQQMTLTESMKKFNKVEAIEKLNKPILLVSKPVAIGNTSLTQHIEIFTAETNELLAHGLGQLILIDHKTRKPITFPASIKSYVNKYIANLGTVNNEAEKRSMSQYKIPDKATIFTHTLHVPYTGIDHNGHLNQSNYVNLFLDALDIAFSNMAFKNAPKSISHLDIEKLSFLYVKESLSGQKLTIKIWRNTENTFLFHFHAYSDDALIHQSEILFSPKLPSSKL